MNDLLLGIDVGTYSSKGVLVDFNGLIKKTVIVDHEMSIPHPGWAEQDANEVWWGDVVKICHQLLDGSPYSGANVKALAVSAIGPCMLPLDSKDNPLRPGILYGVDTRAQNQIDYLNQKWTKESIYEFSKMELSSQAIGPKILWMKENEPDLFEQVSHITTASSYIILRLTGEKVMDLHTASHYIPLFDIDNLNWSEKYSDDLIDIKKLPRVARSNEVAGKISENGADETGLEVGTPVAVGAVDALSEAISVGVVNPGDLMIMYGSTTFFILVENQPHPDPRLWTVAGAFDKHFNLAAGMATTGSLTRWFRDEFALDLPTDNAYDQLFSEASDIDPGSNGLLMLPFFSGERTPINDPNARGVFAGLTLSHKRAHLFRSILEGVAFGIRHNIESFTDIGAIVNRVVAVGGGAKSETWLQIVSDVTGLEQVIPELTIGASYGDAYLAGLAAGLIQKHDLGHWVKVKKIIKPNHHNKEIYEMLFKNYIHLYNNTREIVHQLGKL